MTYSDALSGRELSAVNKTIDGLLKLLYPDAEVPIPDEDLEWAVRIALECRRRVKEQQRRIGAAEFRNTQFGYRIGEGIEQFVSTRNSPALTPSAWIRSHRDRSGRSPRATAMSAPACTASRQPTPLVPERVDCSIRLRLHRCARASRSLSRI